MSRGRPSKLTAKVQEAFCKAIEGGATQAMAAAHAQIGVSTAQSWMAKGREQETGRYRDFVDAFERARERAGLRWLAKVQQLADAKQDWRAYKWLLEVNFPQSFGPSAEFESSMLSAISPAARMLAEMAARGGLEAAASRDLMDLEALPDGARR
jgi:hypothetical protein